MIVNVYRNALRMKNKTDYTLISRFAMSSESRSYCSLLVCSTVRVFPVIMSIRAEVWYLQLNFSPRKHIASKVLAMIPVAELQEKRTMSANGNTTIDSL